MILKKKKPNVELTVMVNYIKRGQRFLYFAKSVDIIETSGSIEM
jgi:hypothetical protein